MTDFKTSDRDVNRAIRSWLHEDRHEDVSRIAGAVLDQVDTIPQRRATWWPAWRTPIMNKLVTYGLGAVAVVVLLFAGSQLFGSSGGTGTEPTPTATQGASAPPLTQSFTSTLHGISMSYPEGWTAQAATEPWTQSTFPLNIEQPYIDVLYHQTLGGDLFLTMGSQPIGDSTPDEWLAAQMATPDQGCGTATEPITVDGASGLIGAEACDVAVVTTAGRGYWLELYTGGDDPAATAAYDRAWFEEVLATVQLQPEAAVEPPPPLTQSFTSTLHGISMSYPEGWTAQAATEPWTGAQANFGEPPADFLYDPAQTDHLFLSIASQPIGDSTPDEWVAQELTFYECTASEPTTVDGATGLIGTADCNAVAVTTGGRGYVVGLYTSGDDPAATAAFGSAWFEEVLATVQLQPEDAVD